jgi:chromosome segregation protein
MYLRSITLKGFKSFPDRTRLEFGPGVSVVVGPNGSGKSNITDAVLWALGEQSPAAVRGQSMQDVIFAGAPGRKASSTAEVELVLDDSSDRLGLGAPEVSIVRRLDRSGEGEYRLAGARCRLVDVIEVLSDTGLGREMHSVISQGRVEALVTSKPRERRLLIEEAAGLGKHRKRRRRAQLKLARTQANLDRALDVEREARSRLRPLKRQAEAAELHARLERQALQARWELAREQLRELEQEVGRAAEREARARERREALERELGEVAARRKQAEEALADRSARREELSRRRFVAQSAAERVAERAQRARRAARELEARLARTRELLAAEEAVDGPEPEGLQGESRRRIESLQAQLEELERRREHALAEQLEELERERRELAARVDQLAVAAQRAAGEREAADARAERARRAVRDAERAAEAARRETARVGGELAAVNQFLSVHAGVRGAPTLADQLEVEPGYELAAAAVLEGRLRAAVVTDRGAAGALLDRAGSEGGRALVAGAARPAVPTAGQAPPAPGARPLAECVRGSAEAMALARGLLADVWVVDSLAQVSADFGGVAVTPAGRVWSAQAGELRQAPAGGEERVLAERNRRRRLVAAGERAARAELAAAAAVERALEEQQRLEAEREEALAAHRRAQLERDEAAEAQRRVEAAIERRRAAPQPGEDEVRRLTLLAELDAERRRVELATRERRERGERVERLRRAAARQEGALPEARALAAALAELGEAIALQQDAFERALAEDRQAGEEVAAALRACAQQEARLQAELHGAGEALTEAVVARQRAQDRRDACRHELEGVAARLELPSEPSSEALGEAEREALRARLERLARRREQLGPVNPLARQQYAEAVDHVRELERQRVDLETALGELGRLIAETDRQIKQTFEETFKAAARNFEQLAAQLFPGGSGRLRLVAERDGPARVLGGQPPPGADPAAEEPAEERREDLLGVEIEINPAGKEMRRLSLLSGGEKSLTALAFLFAVFLARPCPFYILDEVEAALDDVNIDRFLSLLRAYSDRAQFIVVTHQRRTMEAADFLYGVSMGKDGISKVISRRLTDQRAA